MPVILSIHPNNRKRNPPISAVFFKIIKNVANRQRCAKATIIPRNDGEVFLLRAILSVIKVPSKQITGLRMTAIKMKIQDCIGNIIQFPDLKKRDYKNKS